MRQYSNNIAVTKNSRGLYSLDPIMGCVLGSINKKRGCYYDCYAAKSALFHGYNFRKIILREFRSQRHINKIIGQIKKNKLPFIRMGSTGDPSINWEHTIKICRTISNGLKEYQLDLFDNHGLEKKIVIVTKHLRVLSEEQLYDLGSYGVCVNTSISAIDGARYVDLRLNQFHRLKNFCKSILRIVSFSFNTENKLGYKFNEIQKNLFNESPIIDTIFRASKNNPLIKNNIINSEEALFLNNKAVISKYNTKTYFGNCNNCLDMCGINFN